MAVKLRLKRMGKKQAPYYRIVAADSRVKRDGKAIEEIGTYDPKKNPAEVKIDKEATLKWLKTGAQPTDTVRSILSKEGIMKEFHESKSVKEVKKEVVKKEVAKKAPAKKATTTKTAAKKTTTKTTTAKKTTTKKVTTKKEGK